MKVMSFVFERGCQMAMPWYGSLAYPLMCIEEPPDMVSDPPAK